MTVDSLKELLLRQAIRADSYRLNAGMPNETYCLLTTEQGWEAFYSERGQKNLWKRFHAEADACEYLLSMLLADASTRKV